MRYVRNFDVNCAQNLPGMVHMQFSNIKGLLAFRYFTGRLDSLLAVSISRVFLIAAW